MRFAIGLALFLATAVPASARCAGIQAVSITDITLVGIVTMNGDRVAMVTAPQAAGECGGPKKALFLLRRNDAVFDGRVSDITRDKLLFARDEKSAAERADPFVPPHVR